MNLNADNRWIKLGFLLPWDDLVIIYAKHFSDKGVQTINPRLVIGALIIKHKMNLSDEETLIKIFSLSTSTGLILLINNINIFIKMN